MFPCLPGVETSRASSDGEPMLQAEPNMSGLLPLCGFDKVSVRFSAGFRMIPFIGNFRLLVRGQKQSQPGIGTILRRGPLRESRTANTLIAPESEPHEDTDNNTMGAVCRTTIYRLLVH